MKFNPRLFICGLLTVLAVVSCSSCFKVSDGAGAQSPLRSQISVSLIALAYSANKLDDMCTMVAENEGGAAGMKLALTCANALTAVGKALQGADDVVAAWKEGDEGRLACSLKDGADAVLVAIGAIKLALPAEPDGGSGPGLSALTLVGDAVTVAQTLGANCVR